MTTIQDIADKMGVSKSTVSKALNDAPDISEALRKQVLETAVALGYTKLRRYKKPTKKVCIIIEKENIEAITIINDEEFIMPPYQRIVEYIENNYPINIDVEEEWLIYNLRRCINRIGNRDASSEIPSEVIMKILNKSLQISKVPKYKANNIELNFINAIN